MRQSYFLGRQGHLIIPGGQTAAVHTPLGSLPYTQGPRPYSQGSLPISSSHSHPYNLGTHSALPSSSSVTYSAPSLPSSSQGSLPHSSVASFPSSAAHSQPGEQASDEEKSFARAADDSSEAESPLLG